MFFPCLLCSPKFLVAEGPFPGCINQEHQTQPRRKAAHGTPLPGCSQIFAPGLFALCSLYSPELLPLPSWLLDLIWGSGTGQPQPLSLSQPGLDPWHSSAPAGTSPQLQSPAAKKVLAPHKGLTPALREEEEEDIHPSSSGWERITQESWNSYSWKRSPGSLSSILSSILTKVGSWSWKASLEASALPLPPQKAPWAPGWLPLVCNFPSTHQE